MAEGEDPFAYKDPVLDNNLDNDDDQEVDRTRPFQPGASSTPYYGAGQYDMQTMMHEQSGLPDTSYEETPLLGAQAETQNSWDALTRLFQGQAQPIWKLPTVIPAVYKLRSPASAKNLIPCSQKINKQERIG